MKRMDERGESLIREAIQLQSEIDAKQAKLRAIEEKMEPYFPRADQVEYVTSEFGSAHRIVEENIHLDPDQAHTVMAMLGSQFEKYFSVEPWCRPTDECRVKLVSADSHLGHALRPFLIVRRARHYHFSPGRKVMPVVVGGPA